MCRDTVQTKCKERWNCNYNDGFLIGYEIKLLILNGMYSTGEVSRTNSLVEVDGNVNERGRGVSLSHVYGG